MNPFHFNRTYILKNYDFPKQNTLMTKKALFNISVSLSSVWLNKREPDTHLFLHLW